MRRLAWILGGVLVNLALLAATAEGLVLGHGLIVATIWLVIGSLWLADWATRPTRSRLSQALVCAALTAITLAAMFAAPPRDEQVDPSTPVAQPF